MNSRSIADQVVVITGGGTGIGRAAGYALAAEEARVILCGRRGDVLAEAIADGPDTGKLDSRVLDVSDRGAVHATFEDIRDAYGPVDMLVTSAGVNTPRRTMSDMQPDEWDRIMTINATGVYNCMHAVLPDMRSRKDGLIINISSIAGLRASALGGVAYNASKFAVSALGTGVGNEVNQVGIRITSLYPGEVNTPLLDQRPHPVSEAHRLSILQPPDVGQVVRMLATLPAAVHIPEIVVKPVAQEFV